MSLELPKNQFACSKMLPPCISTQQKNRAAHTVVWPLLSSSFGKSRTGMVELQCLLSRHAMEHPALRNCRQSLPAWCSWLCEMKPSGAAAQITPVILQGALCAACFDLHRTPSPGKCRTAQSVILPENTAKQLTKLLCWCRF